MYSLILVDDELYTINNIKQSINWENFGFRVEKVFTKSAAALDYIKNNDIDVVVTDIRMPGVSGIEIAEYCYYNKPKTKVVFLSGYADFEHARSGIKYQVAEYLTKPVSISDIQQMLSKLYTQLQAKKYNQNFIDNELKTEIRKHILNYLSEQSSGEERTITELLNNLGFSTDFSNADFAIVSFLINDLDNFYQNEWKHGRSKLITTLEQLINSVQSCAYISLLYFYEIGFDVFMISNAQVSSDTFNAFVTNHTGSLACTLKECLHINTAASNSMISSDINVIKKFTNDNYAQIQSSGNRDKKFALIAAKDYIDEHYSEKLTLDDISKIANFHPRYFSQLFTDYFNISFSDYLSNVRLEHAKDLLINTNTKVTAVPYLIGLQNFANFSKRFKDYTGYSPSEYQEKYRKK